MAPLRVSLFGKLDVSYGDRPLPVFDAQKTQELFCYLLIYHLRPHCRDELAALLWPEKPAAPAKKYLRQAIWVLQSALGDNEDSAIRLLQAEGEWLQIDPEIDLRLDIARFDQAYNRTRDKTGELLEPSDIQLLSHAVDLYRGDLLEGWYQDWAVFERERYLSMLLTMLDKLVRHSEINRTYEMGIEYGLQILRHDHARECTHRQLMRLHYLAGDRTAALRQYRSCVESLARELDVGPALSTVSLYDQIRLDLLGVPVPEPTNGSDVYSPHGQPSFTATLQHLRQVQAGLDQLSRQVDHCLASFATAMDQQEP